MRLAEALADADGMYDTKYAILAGRAYGSVMYTEDMALRLWLDEHESERKSKSEGL